MAKSTKGKGARGGAKNRGGRTTASGNRAAGSRSSRLVGKDETKEAPASARPAAAAAPAAEEAAPKRSVRPRPAPTKRTTPPASGRYTPPIPRSEKVSPLWVPILMFACLGLGMLIIILNYVNVLPGPDPSNTYLMIGLGLITVGFITATRYH